MFPKAPLGHFQKCINLEKSVFVSTQNITRTEHSTRSCWLTSHSFITSGHPNVQTNIKNSFCFAFHHPHHVQIWLLFVIIWMLWMVAHAPLLLTVSSAEAAGPYSLATGRNSKWNTELVSTFWYVHFDENGLRSDCLSRSLCCLHLPPFFPAQRVSLLCISASPLCTKIRISNVVIRDSDTLQRELVGRLKEAPSFPHRVM